MRFDAPEWATNTPPGLNKLGKILAEVRSALRKSIGKEEALAKSPSALIKSINTFSQQIERKSKEVQEQDPEVSMIESHLSSDESLDILEEEEESVGILASSDISSSSTKSNPRMSTSRAALNITGSDGKVDIEKLRSWSIPKICKHKRTRSGSHVGREAAAQQTRNVSLEASHSRSEPNAHSTPHPQANKSGILDQVREKLNSSKTAKKRKVSSGKNSSTSSPATSALNKGRNRSARNTNR